MIERLLFLRRASLSEKGEVYVEYVVLAGLAVLVILATIQYFFNGISELFQRMGDSVRGLG